MFLGSTGVRCAHRSYYGGMPLMADLVRMQNLATQAAANFSAGCSLFSVVLEDADRVYYFSFLDGSTPVWIRAWGNVLDVYSDLAVVNTLVALLRNRGNSSG